MFNRMWRFVVRWKQQKKTTSLTNIKNKYIEMLICPQELLKALNMQGRGESKEMERFLNLLDCNPREEKGLNQ
ncbi:hypothetical protein KY290_021480 [Solanum tuberosum]|uniref:Uncharacterized protein n=1 Tax=Solanum tuberosum TaxID=4113 RepID=A0ABQ7V3R8_SOLTU|nr:hypothetical protein KY284_020459 [Solanum tuberosum]KAH0682885.1 hypothetical protein KY289_020637 [Solanum tuberosum]KAH0693288.1 hypothetical protein KY285_020385 [Solanum tuberosum]KAH0757987.1 hypothetical protein KY290_021480 [Solanum tuberosum]